MQSQAYRGLRKRSRESRSRFFEKLQNRLLIFECCKDRGRNRLASRKFCQGVLGEVVGDKGSVEGRRNSVLGSSSGLPGEAASPH